MTEVDIARLAAHRSNIHRYQRLLRTRLSDLEQDFILKRLEEERKALQALSRSSRRNDDPQFATAGSAPNGSQPCLAYGG